MTIQAGDRVRVKESSGVCSYLWGHVGTIERVKPVDMLATGQFVVAFDEPQPKPGEFWSPLTTCAFEATQLQSMPSRERVAEIQARSDAAEDRMVQLGFFGGDR